MSKTRDYPQTEFPTRAECDADRREDPAGWNLSTPAESARWRALRAATLAEHAARYGS